MRAKQIPCVLLLMLTPAAWSQQTELQRGIDAHNKGDQAGSIVLFESAVKATPELVLARLHLGSAYLRRVGQEPTFADNMRMAGRALQEFEQALKRDPTNRLAIFQTACAFYYTGNVEEARTWFRRIVQLNAKDADALVALGYTDLSAASRSQLPTRTPATAAAVPLPDAAVRQTLRAKWLPFLNEAQQVLNEAISLNRDDEDALVFLYHVLLRKAELADTPAELRSLAQQADSAKQIATAAKGRGKRPHGISVTLQATAPPPALAFVPALP